MTETLPAAKLATVVCSQSDGQESTRICCEALRAKGPEEVRSALVPARHLRRIYEFRLTKPEIKRDLPLGSDRLLAQLAAYNGDNVRMTVSSPSGIPSLTGRTVIVADGRPAAMFTRPGSLW